MSKDKPKGGLGKGLDVLFGGSEAAEQTVSVPEFHRNITELNPTELNPKSDEQIPVSYTHLTLPTTPYV